MGTQENQKGFFKLELEHGKDSFYSQIEKQLDSSNETIREVENLETLIYL